MTSGPARAERGAVGPLRRRDQGYVTAEAAVVLPALVLVAMSLVWALLAASAQIQCQDAARAGARAAARQDPPEAVLTTTRRAAPRGARVEVSREGDLVRVTVTASAPGPDALTLELSDEAVALAEETVGVSGG
ncbi:TadE family type IV pilus minor pilin [Streptomyces sp. NBC_00038]|uniref:TadE family type IV pilus minor pilin n=1 Tax=Streptomyces sp. NBC_00038 TaxID=2903615 RepID=UPI0022543452|nr:TadE family type IV pilus minor pilin [Streptomyces sp. NBC_00038]MCX5559536.1 pilus assembly protein [Streptomyces sp. NBC_00038]